MFGKPSLRASTRELVSVADKIGALNKRILALVEGKEKSDPENASGVEPKTSVEA
jgi:hypothetical protein